MRAIKYIVLHCTATPMTATVASIQNYWRTVLGWKSPGYHYLIDAAGTVHTLSPESEPTNGVKGYNLPSVHVSYIGGIDGQKRPFDTRTPAQLAAMEKLVRQLMARYPRARVLGHRDFPGVTKACPSFDVAAWLDKVGIKKPKAQ